MKIPTQLVRFALVGILNTLLHLAVIGGLVELAGLNQLVSNAAAYLVASTFSFIVNSFWSFGVRPEVGRFARFQLVGLLGLSVSALTGYLGDTFGWHFVVTVLVTGCIVPLLSFLAHRAYTFAS